MPAPLGLVVRHTVQVSMYVVVVLEIRTTYGGLKTPRYSFWNTPGQKVKLGT